MSKEVEWTDEQKDAIYEKNSNILVAAAAGSGKTAVLVERIINKILNENIDIDKLLVVTFTNAAASEMRERVLDAIYKKLDEDIENENLQKQITLLNKSNICTIDSFCLDIVRNNFFELDISPNFRIGDNAEIELLKQEVIEELFEEKYENEDKDFIKLLNTYTSYKDDTPLKELILKIYTYIQSNPFPDKWLKEKIEMFNLQDKLDVDFGTTIWGKYLLQDLDELVTDSVIKLEQAKRRLRLEEELSMYVKIISDDIEQLQTLKQNLNTWDLAYNASETLNFKTWTPSRKIVSDIKDEAKAIRDNVKNAIYKKLEKIMIFTSEEANKDMFDMYETLYKLQNLILEFEEKFASKKKERNIVDFSDIEHFALQILLKEDDDGNLIKTEVAKKYEEKFEEIAIDEYQDSNLVQEYILTAVSRGNNIFMVGDVKQSIYKFRQARPELFLEKYSNYKLKSDKTQEDDLKIQLFKNFRSRSGVLDFTNIIFQNIMGVKLGDIDYTKEEYLNLGAKYGETGENLKTEIDIINLEEPEESESENLDDEEETEEIERVENIELEARFVAKRIKQLVDSKFKVYNPKDKTTREITYKDIVILLRSTKAPAPIFEKELVKLNIPVFSDTTSDYLDSIEIQTILNLLKIIDNPMQEIPLIAIMRSSIGEFTDNELVQIRLADKHDNFYNTILKAKFSVDENLKNKIDKFLNKLEEWRKKQEYLSLDELIWKIYSDTGYYNFVGLMNNGMQRQANLKMLFEQARNCETISFKGLFNFINYIEKVRTSSGDMDSAKIIGENDNVVRIMSIHKSKGLEFPVVFLSHTSKQINMKDLNDKILLHQDIGIGISFIDYDLQIRYDTLSKLAMKNKLLLETYSEEMRILYVALTRAKEKLIITGYSKDDKKKTDNINSVVRSYEKEDKINPIAIKKYKTYLDWIRLVLAYNDNLEDLVDINIYQKNDVIKDTKIEAKEDDDTLKNIFEKLDNEDLNDSEKEKIKNILEYEYNYQDSIKLPTKTSVTALKQLANEKNKSSEEAETIHKQLDMPKPKFLNEDKEIKLTGAQKGTILHLCMQKLDVRKKYTLDDVKGMVEQLKFKKIITELEADNINIRKIYSFTKSNIWKELQEAKEVYKEKPFYINIPLSEVLDSEADENILVQGIIDLYYIDKNDNLVLLDYKTDFVENSDEQILINKYKTQLDLYKRALEEALHRNVDKVYIYSTYLEKEIEIKAE